MSDAEINQDSRSNQRNNALYGAIFERPVKTSLAIIGVGIRAVPDACERCESPKRKESRCYQAHNPRRNEHPIDHKRVICLTPKAEPQHPGERFCRLDNRCIIQTIHKLKGQSALVFASLLKSDLDMRIVSIRGQVVITSINKGFP